MSGLIAIVGRPNVGKSALFNRIVRKRIAIVHDQPGVTRDRVMAEAEWEGRGFTLVDTGGIGLLRGERVNDVITEAALQQVEIAIESASVIIFVVNVQEGIVPLDSEVAGRLRRSGKPILVAVNKVDTAKAEGGMDEFTALGFDQIFPVTAIHGDGIDNLMMAALAFLPAQAATGNDPDVSSATQNPPLKLAIVGRPNVGKSSIINALTKSDRVIVSPIPGTTRDAVDVPFTVVGEGGNREDYLLIDTAGVRQERRVDDAIEVFSIQRTEDSIKRCDIVVFMIDAESGVLMQDKKIADKIIEAKKACILVINKWDLVSTAVQKAREDEIEGLKKKAHIRSSGQRPMTTLSDFGSWVQEKLFFLDFAPVIFTSAISGFQLERLLESIRFVAAELKKKIPTSILNRTFREIIDQKQPVSAKGHLLKFFYATQVQQAPPTFVLFVNRDELFSDQYMRFFTHEMRKVLGYEGCPLILHPRARPKTIAPVRKYAETGRRPAPRPKPGKPVKPGDKPQSLQHPSETAKKRPAPPARGPKIKVRHRKGASASRPSRPFRAPGARLKRRPL